MNRLVVIQVERSVDLQSVVEEASFVANLISYQLFGIVIRRVTEENEVISARAISGCGGEVHHDFFIDVPIQIDSTGEFFILTFERTVHTDSDWEAAIGYRLRWGGLSGDRIKIHCAVCIHYKTTVGGVDLVRGLVKHLADRIDEVVCHQARQNVSGAHGFVVAEQVFLSKHLVVGVANTDR